PWMIRREPLMLNVWSQTIDLKKAEIKKAPVWVKFHHVPIVAYSKVGLSLISTQVGKPITFDSYTSNMCVSSWGRSTYARVLIEVSAKNELKDELVVDKSSKKDDSKTTNEPTGSTRSADKSNILVSNSFNILENKEEDTLGDTVLSSTINESDSEDVDEELLVA
nr:hypothetical protein [Tanacetum cinerariifolium]